MTVLELVDRLYEAFADALGGELAEHSRDLSVALELAPKRVPWSQVFSYDVTLGAPALFAGAMPQVSVAVVQDAVAAHMFAVIGAFGADRIEDGQIRESSNVLSILAHVRGARDAAFERVCRGRTPLFDLRAADEMVRVATKTERQMLRDAVAIDLVSYERISLAKQSVGLVASLALANVAGWDARRCTHVLRTLESIALALQMYDDAVDWEHDELKGGSWVGAIARRELGRPAGSHVDRNDVFKSRALSLLLDRARAHARSARRRANVLGVSALALWAAEFENRLAVLAAAECSHGGYVVRARELSAWAQEVLA